MIYKARIEVNEDGEFFVILTDELVAQYNLDEGDLVEVDCDDDELVILSFP